LCRSNGA